MHCIGFPKKHFCVVDPYSRGESGWCPDGTSTPGAWRHAGVQFLLSGEVFTHVTSESDELTRRWVLSKPGLLCRGGRQQNSDEPLGLQSSGPMSEISPWSRESGTAMHDPSLCAERSERRDHA